MGNVVRSVACARAVYRRPLSLQCLLHSHEGSSRSRDTVFALSSAPGKCGVSVIRVSGPAAHQAAVRLGGKRGLPHPRQATLRQLVDPVSGETIDHGLLLWFPGPNSFTGEDTVEFHVHGGTAVVSAMLSALGSLPGQRHAAPGEFTRRAFFNGKLDLTEVEGLADLIQAETQAQRLQALRQMEGDLSKLYNGWSQSLLRGVAHVEATIDFGEEENIEEGLVENVREMVKQLMKEIRSHLNDGRRGERLRSGIHMAILGPPNVGKSTLLNLITQRPAAIVSPHAGTTRDVVETSLDLFGYPVILSDTAGLRASQDPVEQEGMKRAVQKSELADLRIVMADCSQALEYCPLTASTSFTDLMNSLLNTNASGEWSDMEESNTILVMNKMDLMEDTHHSSLSRSPVPMCWMSCKTQQGVEQFMSLLKERLQHLGGVPLSSSPLITQSRHRHHLMLCMEDLEQFIAQSGGCGDGCGDLVLAADSLRCALYQLARVTGAVSVEHILDKVFDEFCIGK